MEQHYLNGFYLIFPDVPEGAEEVKIFIESGYTFIHFSKKGLWRIPVKIAPGDWQLFRLSCVPEELAGEMVKCYELGCRYKDYTPANPDVQLCGIYLPTVKTAHASLASWVRSKGVEGDPWMLINKID